MELIILGKNTKSKGAELERFCRRLFIKLGFKNSTLNFIALRVVMNTMLPRKKSFSKKMEQKFPFQ